MASPRVLRVTVLPPVLRPGDEVTTRRGWFHQHVGWAHDLWPLFRGAAATPAGGDADLAGVVCSSDWMNRGGLASSQRESSGAGVGQIQLGDDRASSSSRCVVDFGYLFRELPEDNFFFRLFIGESVVAVDCPVPTHAGWVPRRGWAAAGGGIVDNAGNGVFLGGFDRGLQSGRPVGLINCSWNGPGLALQNALQSLANATADGF